MGLQWGDVAGWVSVLATALTAGFVLVQIWHYVQAQKNIRSAEVDGVAVEWHAHDVQSNVQPGDWSVSTYIFTAHNPGRLPIREVSVSVDMGTLVRRGDRPDLAPTSMIELDTPVIRSGGSRTWTRPVSVLWDEWEQLRTMSAVINFKLSKNGAVRTNTWAEQVKSFGTAVGHALCMNASREGGLIQAAAGSLGG